MRPLGALKHTTKKSRNELSLISPICIIGSAPECFIRLYTPNVIEQHCRIKVDVLKNGVRKATLTNLAGSHTLINEMPITSHVLREGDIIHIGDTEFEWLAADNSELPETATAERKSMPSHAKSMPSHASRFKAKYRGRASDSNVRFRYDLSPSSRARAVTVTKVHLGMEAKQTEFPQMQETQLRKRSKSLGPAGKSVEKNTSKRSKSVVMRSDTRIPRLQSGLKADKASSIKSKLQTPKKVTAKSPILKAKGKLLWSPKLKLPGKKHSGIPKLSQMKVTKGKIPSPIKTDRNKKAAIMTTFGRLSCGQSEQNEITEQPKTPSKTISLKKTPGKTPNKTPKSSLKKTPGKTPNKTPKSSLKKTPGKTPNKTPESSIKKTPGKTPNKTPKSSLKKTPGRTPNKTPKSVSKQNTAVTPTGGIALKMTPGKTLFKTPNSPKSSLKKTPGKTPNKTRKSSLKKTPGKTPNKTPKSVSKQNTAVTPTGGITLKMTPGKTPNITPKSVSKQNTPKVGAIFIPMQTTPVGSATLPPKHTSALKEKLQKTPLVSTPVSGKTPLVAKSTPQKEKSTPLNSTTPDVGTRKSARIASTSSTPTAPNMDLPYSFSLPVHALKEKLAIRINHVASPYKFTSPDKLPLKRLTKSVKKPSEAVTGFASPKSVAPAKSLASPRDKLRRSKEHPSTPMPSGRTTNNRVPSLPRTPMPGTNSKNGIRQSASLEKIIDSAESGSTPSALEETPKQRAQKKLITPGGQNMNTPVTKKNISGNKSLQTPDLQGFFRTPPTDRVTRQTQGTSETPSLANIFQTPEEIHSLKKRRVTPVGRQESQSSRKASETPDLAGLFTINPETPIPRRVSQSPEKRATNSTPRVASVMSLQLPGVTPEQRNSSTRASRSTAKKVTKTTRASARMSMNSGQTNEIFNTVIKTESRSPDKRSTVSGRDADVSDSSMSPTKRKSKVLHKPMASNPSELEDSDAMDERMLPTVVLKRLTKSQLESAKGSSRKSARKAFTVAKVDSNGSSTETAHSPEPRGAGITHSRSGSPAPNEASLLQLGTPLQQCLSLVNRGTNTPREDYDSHENSNISFPSPVLSVSTFVSPLEYESNMWLSHIEPSTPKTHKNNQGETSLTGISRLMRGNKSAKKKQGTPSFQGLSQLLSTTEADEASPSFDQLETMLATPGSSTAAKTSNVMRRSTRTPSQGTERVIAWANSEKGQNPKQTTPRNISPLRQLSSPPQGSEDSSPERVSPKRSKKRNIENKEPSEEDTNVDYIIQSAQTTPRSPARKRKSSHLATQVAAKLTSNETFPKDTSGSSQWQIRILERQEIAALSITHPASICINTPHSTVSNVFKASSSTDTENYEEGTSTAIASTSSSNSPGQKLGMYSESEQYSPASQRKTKAKDSLRVMTMKKNLDAAAISAVLDESSESEESIADSKGKISETKFTASEVQKQPSPKEAKSVEKRPTRARKNVDSATVSVVEAGLSASPAQSMRGRRKAVDAVPAPTESATTKMIQETAAASTLSPKGRTTRQTKVNLKQEVQNSPVRKKTRQGKQAETMASSLDKEPGEIDVNTSLKLRGKRAVAQKEVREVPHSAPKTKASKHENVEEPPATSQSPATKRGRPAKVDEAKELPTPKQKNTAKLAVLKSGRANEAESTANQSPASKRGRRAKLEEPEVTEEVVAPRRGRAARVIEGEDVFESPATKRGRKAKLEEPEVTEEVVAPRRGRAARVIEGEDVFESPASKRGRKAKLEEPEVTEEVVAPRRGRAARVIEGEDVFESPASKRGRRANAASKPDEPQVSVTPDAPKRGARGKQHSNHSKAAPPASPTLQKGKSTRRKFEPTPVAEEIDLVETSTQAKGKATRGRKAKKAETENLEEAVAAPATRATRSHKVQPEPPRSDAVKLPSRSLRSRK